MHIIFTHLRPAHILGAARGNNIVKSYDAHTLPVYSTIPVTIPIPPRLIRNARTSLIGVSQRLQQARHGFQKPFVPKQPKFEG